MVIFEISYDEYDRDSTVLDASEDKVLHYLKRIWSKVWL